MVLSELTVNIRLAVTTGYFNFGYESEKSTVESDMNVNKYLYQIMMVNIS